MKKLLFISIGALLLSACSTSNKISITKSRYGNGIGISFGNDGMSKAEQKKAEHFNEVVSERAQHKKFLQSISLDKRTPKPVSFDDQIPQPLVLSKNEATPSKEKASQELTQNEVNGETPKQQTEVAVELETKDLVNTLDGIQPETNTKGGLSDDGVALLLLVILAIILAPLAVFLYEGEINNRFWICLILWLLSFGILGVLYALILILGGY